MAEPSPQAHHRLSASGLIGTLAINVSLDLHSPWTVLFGASGSGKTTLLRAMTGAGTGLSVTFQRAGGIGWQTLQDATLHIAPEHRNIAYAPQQAMLFPHLTSAQNIRFPQAVRKPSPDALSSRVIELLDLQSLAGKLPHQLSGGERQRVSLARALAVPDAQLLLLDEPFAGIDRATRDRLLHKVQRFAAGRNLPAVSVTHDVDEALLLHADVIRLQNGEVTAQGPAHTVLADEIDRMRRTLQ